MIVKNKSEQYLSRVVYFDYPVRMTREDQHEHDDVLRSFLLKQYTRSDDEV